jgi:hypothetical protein
VIASPHSSSPWQLTRATVRGKAHVGADLPNQDWVEVCASADGRIVAGVVSDGAGTAAHAERGSRTTCQLMAPWMLAIGHDMASQPHDEAMVHDRVVLGLEHVRASLQASGIALRDQHCTFVACVLTDEAAFVCQVGDSIAICSHFEQASGKGRGEIDFFPDGATHLFEVERGEYANETHFITEPDWRAHLRVRHVATPMIDAMLLMSDGAMEIATTRGKVFRGFLSNLVATLLALEDAGARDTTLNDWLADRRTFPITGDDKTMLVAIRGSCLGMAGAPVYAGETGLAPPTQRPALPPSADEPPPSLATDSAHVTAEGEAESSQLSVANLRASLASGVAAMMAVIAAACLIYRGPIADRLGTTMECIVGPAAMPSRSAATTASAATTRRVAHGGATGSSEPAADDVRPTRFVERSATYSARDREAGGTEETRP